MNQPGITNSDGKDDVQILLPYESQKREKRLCLECEISSQHLTPQKKNITICLVSNPH